MSSKLNRKRLDSLLGAVVAVLIFGVQFAMAQESVATSPELVNTEAFAMDTSVYSGAAKSPLVTTKTVFVGRRAYDQVTGPSGAIAVFDFDRQVIDLLDPANRVRTIVTFKELLEFQSAQAAMSEVQSDHKSFGAFLASPKFTDESDGSTIRLRSPFMSYEAKGGRSTSDTVERFVEFADWSARLGCRMNPQGPPAKARLELNAALKKQNWQVSRITRIGGPNARAARMLRVSRSEHVYRKTLSKDDRVLISRAEKSLESFRQISFSDFHAFQNSGRVATKK